MSHDNHMRDREIDQERTRAAAFNFPDGRAANTPIFYKEDDLSNYQPKHMIDRDAILDKWQTQAKVAAARLRYVSTDPLMSLEDRQVWAFLHTMGASKEVVGALYDYGADDTYVPKHMRPA